ncbi:aminoacyl--tRNA ligase-related protein [Salarchaeum sp. JOR-1]|uniref:aminoacyl--tRNA ligase-related protein n=1 Tax=Salarchaeum sp. JOR-1 TaxID=2599399 RepID=UPI0011988F7F|nr:aminoacyl--tRNA ligase-related protein [Salarchaeum sp. JOR-1]QDX41683.1 proline--tRNA ligase [Salarchaeum sp. JOR-1]
MRRSDAFLPTSRETRGSGSATTKLLARAGLIRGFGSGLWAFTPAGHRVREHVTACVRGTMTGIGAQEVSLPGLQYAERWRESGRWASFEGEMFTFENRDGQAMCLAPSHEEGVVHLLDGLVRSYDDLPLLVYQVDAKFRDDRARDGLIRAKEFRMKDAYSVHTTQESLDETYQRVRDAYERILTDLGLDYAVCAAENSVMGGARSEEFVAPVAEGGDRLKCCPDCRFGVTDEHDDFRASETCPDCGRSLRETDGVEVGHVFDLGTRYSDAMEFTVDDADGEERAALMASYGLGIDRIVQTLARQHADEDGLRWPVTDWGCVAPYHAAIVPIGYDGDVKAAADAIHDACGGVLLYDDPGQSVGERFAESDLLGIPAKIVVGNHYRDTGRVELETRDGDQRDLAPADVPDAIEEFGAGTLEGAAEESSAERAVRRTR